MGLWRAEAAGRNLDRSYWDISTGGRESPGKGGKVQQGVGWGGLLKHWLASSTPRWRKGSGRISALWPPQVAQYIMLEAILLKEKGSQVEDPVDRLLIVLEVVVRVD